jgi:transposase
MKKDAEVWILKNERKKGATQKVAAARAGMSERTARKYEQAGQLPSQRKRPRQHRTRPDPFASEWAWVVAQLERDPALQATTLFALLQAKHPGRYQEGQLRTLQRHIATWRAVAGPERAVMFEQVHQPGDLAESDFTHMNSLGVTLGGVPFSHELFHLVLTYSNVEAAHVCVSESFEALAEGIEHCLWQLGGVPRRHKTDHMGTAVRPLSVAGQAEFTARYQGLMAHYGMEPTMNNAGKAHENGDVEQSHYRLKMAIDQALRVRGSRDFADRASYERFVAEIIRQRNLTRASRFTAERAALRPLPTMPLSPCRELHCTVTQYSTIHVLENTYSVPSRLIGSKVLVRLHAETVEVYVGTSLVCRMPRLSGRQQHAIDYRHVIWSLVRKPGAFAAYRYREELFPTLLFRQAYDRLQQSRPASADREYLRLLSLAASTTESEVATALSLLLEAQLAPTFEAVRELVQGPRTVSVPAVETPPLDLTGYDQLLPSRRRHA